MVLNISTGPLIHSVLNALIDLPQERGREEIDEGIRVMWTRSEAVVVIEGVKEAIEIETVRVIDTETETENAVVKGTVKEATAVTDMVTGIATTKGTEMTEIVIAGARERTIMRDLNVVRMTELKGRNLKYLTNIYLNHRHHHHHHLVCPHPLLLHMTALPRFVHLTEEMATCERSTTIHQEADAMVAVTSMTMIFQKAPQ